MAWQKDKPRSEESKKRISESMKGKHAGVKNPMYGKKGPLCPSYGKPKSEEHCKRLSKSLVGRDLISKNARQRAAEKMRGSNNPRCGVSLSPELRKRISDSETGKKITKEAIEKGLKTRPPGWHHSKETRLKITKALSGQRSSFWRGGITKRRYCPKFNTVLKEEIRDRFGRKCFLCPITEEERGKKLDVHHCDYNKGQGCGQKWSLLPLCHKCHMKTNTHRHYYFALLSNYWAMNPEINFNSQEIMRW